MTERTNADRAADGKAAIGVHRTMVEIGILPEFHQPPTAEDVIDLVTNLMHFMVKHDIEVNEVISMAKLHLEEELSEEAES